MNEGQAVAAASGDVTVGIAGLEEVDYSRRRVLPLSRNLRLAMAGMSPLDQIIQVALGNAGVSSQPIARSQIFSTFIANI